MCYLRCSGVELGRTACSIESRNRQVDSTGKAMVTGPTSLEGEGVGEMGQEEVIET